MQDGSKSAAGRRTIWPLILAIALATLGIAYYYFSPFHCPSEEKVPLRIFTDPREVFITVAALDPLVEIVSGMPLLVPDTGYSLALSRHNTYDISVRSQRGSDSASVRVSTGFRARYYNGGEIRIRLYPQAIKEIDTLYLCLAVDISRTIEEEAKVDTLMREIYHLLLPNHDIFDLCLFCGTWWPVSREDDISCAAQDWCSVLDKYKKACRLPDHDKLTTRFDTLFHRVKRRIQANRVQGDQYEKVLIILSDGVHDSTTEASICPDRLARGIRKGVDLLAKLNVSVLLFITETDCRSEIDRLKSLWNECLLGNYGRCYDLVTGSDHSKHLAALKRKWGRHERIEFCPDGVVDYDSVKNAFDVGFRVYSTMRRDVATFLTNARLVDLGTGKESRSRDAYAQMDTTILVPSWASSKAGAAAGRPRHMRLVATVAGVKSLHLKTYRAPHIAFDYSYIALGPSPPVLDTVYFPVTIAHLGVLRQVDVIVSRLANQIRRPAIGVLLLLWIVSFAVLWLCRWVYRNDLRNLYNRFAQYNPAKTRPPVKILPFVLLRDRNEQSDPMSLNLCGLARRAWDTDEKELKQNENRTHDGIPVGGIADVPEDRRIRIRRFDVLFRLCFSGLVIAAGLAVALWWNLGISILLLLGIMVAVFVSGLLLFIWLNVRGWIRNPIWHYGLPGFLFVVQLISLIQLAIKP